MCASTSMEIRFVPRLFVFSKLVFRPGNGKISTFLALFFMDPVSRGARPKYCLRLWNKSLILLPNYFLGKGRMKCRQIFPKTGQIRTSFVIEKTQRFIAPKMILDVEEVRICFCRCPNVSTCHASPQHFSKHKVFFQTIRLLIV